MEIHSILTQLLRSVNGKDALCMNWPRVAVFLWKSKADPRLKKYRIRYEYTACEYYTNKT
jgi:hypothetical protein